MVSFVPMAAVDEVAGVISSLESRPFSEVAKGYTAFQDGDVLFAKITPCMENGKAAIATGMVNGLGFGSTEFYVLRPAERVLSEFIFYFVRQPSFRAKAKANFSGTAGQQRVPKGFLEGFLIPLPPLEEQRRIIDILKRADSIRRLRQQALETTRALIPALFVDMFGDPATNPKGWEVVTLGRLISDGPQNGLYKHASAYGEGTPILRIDAFYDGVVTEIGSLRRLRLEAGEVAKYQLKENDLVINRVNSPEYLGKTAIVPELSEPIVFESNMMRFSVDAGIVDPRFLIQYLQSGFVKEQILGKAKHAINQSSINQQDVKSFLVPLPPIALQRCFANRVADMISLLGQQSRHLVQAEALQQSLLAQFFS